MPTKIYLLLFAPLATLIAANLTGTPEELARIWKGDFTDQGSPSQADSLRVVDWNIDRGSRFEQVADALQREHPDLCVLQEVDLFAHRSGKRNVSDDLAKRLHTRYVFASAWQELSQGDRDGASYQGQVILTSLPVKSVRVIRFETQSGFWKPHSYLPDWQIMQRRVGGRIALVAELDFHGKTLVVYNAHLESRSLGKLQTLQLEEILADAKRYPEGTPIVLAGDLNTKYNAAAFSHKLRADGWESAFGDRTPRTHRIACSLDWILVRGPLHLNGGQVVHNAGGSDHYPVFAEMSLSATQIGRKTSN